MNNLRKEINPRQIHTAGLDPKSCTVQILPNEGISENLIQKEIKGKQNLAMLATKKKKQTP
jgi:hypothetical protein